ncbi:HEAT repeat domain-containing protein [candidate division KSB1 bacterium]|nr:HEAT repeat domain-containing protein [candidate division KSB1 bacterium]
MMINRLPVLCLALSLAAWCVAGLRAQSLPAELDSALNFAGLTVADFASDRMWAEDDTFLLPKIRESLESPISAYKVAHELAAASPVDVSAAGLVNKLMGFIDAELPEVVTRDIDAQLAAAKSHLIDPFEPMLSAFALAEGYRAQAFGGLSVAEQQALLLAIPLWFEDEDLASDDTLKGSIHRALGVAVDTSQQVTSDSVLTLLSLVNRQALAAAAYALARGTALTAAAWEKQASPFMTAAAPGVEGLVLATRATPYGTFVMGGGGPNVYSGDFAFIIDLGGDDRYVRRVASAVGQIGHGVSAVIDVKGNDAYVSGSMCDQACAILGVAALADLSGDDIYRAGAFSQSAAFCGASFLFDSNGDDTYRAGIFSQSASVCGVSVLSDGNGRDLYDAYHSCQAFASTFAVAALVEGGGNDCYRAGGFETHAPLRPEDYRSFAQGFAIGSRPRGGGGFALLRDLSGNDFYNAEIYAQGVGYWYSLGALLDEGGNDAYDATQYSQGSGIHLAAGVLEDLSGDDRYGSRFGPGQGGAHDLAVGMLYDHTGDDQYISSGGHGMAITNSGALFIDGRGNDLYAVSEPDFGQGAVRPARSFGNLGVFVDGEGKDTYVNGGADSSLWFQGIYAVGYDVPRDSTTPREAQPDVKFVAEDTTRSLADLFREAALWEVTDNREKVRRARLALNEKAGAIPWVGEHKLGTNDALERRAITELFKTKPDAASPFLEQALNSADRWKQRNALVIYGELKYKPAVPLVISKLADGGYARVRPAILTTLGDLGDTSATLKLIPFASSTVERERIAAVASLGKLQDPRGFDAILERVVDPAYTVRSAAIMAIAAQDTRVLLRLEQEFSLRETDRLETLLLACGLLAERWKTDDKLKQDLKLIAPTVKRYLDHPEPRVQGAALVATAQVTEATPFRKLSARFAGAPDPVLRARLAQALHTYP